MFDFSLGSGEIYFTPVEKNKTYGSFFGCKTGDKRFQFYNCFIWSSIQEKLGV